MELAEFNALTDADASATVSVWAAIPSWVAQVVASRPYACVDDLADTAGRAALEWTVADLDDALAHHPRIGDRPDTLGAHADASRREQAAMTTVDPDVAARIAAGNAEYERRFDRVFLIRAAGRTPDEMLAELRRRLSSDPDDEASEALRQLDEIALLRLRGAVVERERMPS